MDDMKLQRLVGWLIALGLLLAVPGVSGPANAASCERPTPAEHIDHSDAVFFGGVADRRWRGDIRDDENKIVEFRVVRAYKGVEGDTIRIRFLNDHGKNRGWGFSRHRPTLVFAYSVKDDGEGPLYEVHYCTMIPYHGRPARHPFYWDILAGMKP
jgi:hypothetical protein